MNLQRFAQPKEFWTLLQKRFSQYYNMKPQHQLMLRKVGKGRVFFPGQARTMDIRQGDRHATKEEIDAKEGMGVKAKRKPLKFKL
jgi:hypothetical protein